MKTVEDLFLSTAQDKKYSPVVSMTGSNSAMFEVWITSASNINATDGVKVYLEGSNDGVNWDTNVGLNTTTGSGFDTSTIPAYQAFSDTSLLVPYAEVRLRFEVASAGTGTALVSAYLRPWRAA